ncbi:MAG: hypothetical protein BWK72_12225 [Rhodoferax ferrireducens]|uniref:Uncharacterized protein n=1 Tax=Rhodoferax ferrireducens TaxID=192843 RepID=A0A1W9KT93_9BURK|nr:MAG: hypothetical protein BWK72_12225 [Rhodoferax ferrireducens]
MTMDTHCMAKSNHMKQNKMTNLNIRHRVHPGKIKIWAASVALLTGCATAQNASAFGIGDIVSIGVQAGGKLIGAAVDVGMDKVKDAMTDPEAEAAKKKAQEQKQAEGYRKALAEIEARHDLSPLQREKLTVAFKKQYAQVQQFQQFVQAAEARQKAQRDQIFTGAGLLGVVGDAALSTPSMAMAKADVMSRSPTMRAQINTSIHQADMLNASGIPQAQARMAIAQTDAIVKNGLLPAETKGAAQLAEVAASVDITAAMQLTEQPVAMEVTTTAVPSEPVVAPQPKDAFSPDVGKKIYLEFVGSVPHTQALKSILTDHGYSVVDNKSDADVAYLIEGEYAIPENKQHKGLSLSIGPILDDPSKPIEKPETKMTGSIGLGLNKLFIAMTQAQGANVPPAALPKESNGFHQQVLLVTARQPKDGAETRFSVVKEVESAEIEGRSLAQAATHDMLDRLGLLARN